MQSNRNAAGDTKTRSQYELRKNVEALVTAAGGDPWNQPAQVYLIRRADRNIWVHYCATTSSAAWLILETAAFQPTADLKPQTDTAG